MLQVSADESTDRGGTLKFLFTIVDLHEFGRAVQPLGRCGVQASNPACAGWSLFHHPLNGSAIMSLSRTLCLACCLVLLQGCFDSSDNETQDNTGGSKSSVQMKDSKADQP